MRLLPLLTIAAAGVLAAPASAGDFRTSANAACDRYDRTTNALPAITSKAELRRQMVLVPKLFRAMVERIAAVPSSPRQRAQAAQLVGSLRVVQRTLDRVRDAFLSGDRAGVAAAIRAGTAPSRAAARSARALGLPTCARLASEAAKGPQP